MKQTSILCFLDLLFNMLMLFICLFTLALIQMNPKDIKSTKTVESKAEYIITVTWDKEIDADVDSYLEDPLNNICYFGAREKGLMHLDRDDLGHRNDTVLVNGQKIEFKDNREILSIRGIFEGEYIFNVHMYGNWQKIPTKVHVQIDRLNPSIMTVFQKDVLLEQTGQEITVTRFTITDKGNIVDFNDLEKNLVKNGPTL